MFLFFFGSPKVIIGADFSQIIINPYLKNTDK